MVNQNNNVPILEIPPVVANPVNGLSNAIDNMGIKQPKSVNPLINFANAAAEGTIGLTGSRIGLIAPTLGETISQFGQETFPSQPGISQFLGSLVPTIAETTAAAILPIPGTRIAKLAQLGLIGSNVAATAGEQRIKILRARRDNLQDIPFTDEFLATAGSGLITAFSEQLGFRYIKDNLSKVRRQDIIDLALASTYKDTKAAAEAFKRISSQAGGKNLSKIFGEQAFEEGFQESVEQLGLNAVEKFIYNPNLSLSEGLAESFIGGSIAGGAVLGLGVIYDRAKNIYNGSDPRINLEASIEEKENLKPLYGFRVHNKNVSPFTTSEDIFDLFFSFEPAIPKEITALNGIPVERAAELYIRRIFDFRNPEHIRRFAKKVFSKDSRLVDKEGKNVLTDKELNQTIDTILNIDLNQVPESITNTILEEAKNIASSRNSNNKIIEQVLFSVMSNIISTRLSAVHFIETGIYRESIIDLGFDSYLTYEGLSDIVPGYKRLNIGIIDRSKVVFLDNRPDEDYIRNNYTTTRSSGELMSRDDRQDFRVVSGSKPTEVGGFVVAFKESEKLNSLAKREPIIDSESVVFRNIESANDYAKKTKGFSLGFIPNKVLQKIDGFNNQFQRSIDFKPEAKRSERLLVNTLSNKFERLMLMPKSMSMTLSDINKLLDKSQEVSFLIDFGFNIPEVKFTLYPKDSLAEITINESINLSSEYLDLSKDLIQEDLNILKARALDSSVIHGFIDFQRSNILVEINHPSFNDKSLDYRIARVNEYTQLSFLRYTGYSKSPVGLNLDDAMQGKQITPKNNSISFPLEFMQTGGNFPLTIIRIKAAIHYLEDIEPNTMSKAGSIVVVPDSYINKLIGQDDTSNIRVNGVYTSIMEGLDTNGLPDITPGAIFINSDSINSVEDALRIISHKVKHKLDENREDFKQLGRVFNDNILKQFVNREQVAEAYATRITRKFLNNLHNDPTIIEFQPKVGGKRILAANELPKLQAFIQGTGLVDEIIISEEQLLGPKKDIDGNDILDETGQIIIEPKNGLLEVDSVTGKTTIKLSPKVDQNTILHELVHAYLIHVGEYTSEMQMLLQTFDYDRENMIDGIADYIFGRLQPKGLFQAIGQRLYDFMVGARQIIGLANSRLHLLNIISKQIIKTKDGKQVRASEFNKNMQEKSYLNQQLKNLFKESSVDRLFELAKGINLEFNNTSKTIKLGDIEKAAIELLGNRDKFEDLIIRYNSSEQPRLNSIDVVALNLFREEKLKSLFFMNFDNPEKIKAWQNEILSSSIMNRNPASEAGRVLAAHKHYAKVMHYSMQLLDQAKELTPKTIIEFQNAVVKALDPRRQDLEELMKLYRLHTESPTIQNLLVEMYIGNLLSGPPTLFVNLFGNWTWQKYNINIHDKLTTSIDKYLNDSNLGRMLGNWGLFSKSREYFIEKQFKELLNEALIDGKAKGLDYSKKLLRGDFTAELGDRYEIEIGITAVDAFRRFDSDNIPVLKNLNKITKKRIDKFMHNIAAPMITAFPRIIRAIDAYFRGIAFEYNMAKIAIREVINNRIGILRLMKKSKSLAKRQLDSLTKIAQERSLLEQEKRIILRETDTLNQLNSMLNNFKEVTTAELVTALRRDPLGMLGNVKGKELQDEAAEQAAKYLFMDKQKGFSRTLEALRNRLGLPGKLLVPIMNTPLNLLKRGIELTPLAGAIYGIPKAKRKVDRIKIEKTYDTWYRVYKRQELLRRRIDNLNKEGKDSTKANNELNKLLSSIRLKPGELINLGQIKALRKMRANRRRLSTSKGEDNIQNIIAKQLEGTFLALIFIMLFDRDEITGPVPKDPNKRDAFYRQGKTPWSFRVGNTWVSYRNMEPFNTPIAAASSAWQWFNDTDAKPDDYTFEKFVSSINDYIAKSTWISNISPLITGRGLQNTLYNIPANFVPYSSLQRSINNMIEVAFEGGRVIEEREDFIDAFSPVIIKPVASLLGITSEPRQNVWGQDIKVPEDFLQQWLPFSWTEQTQDYVELELERISMYPGIPKQKITYEGREIELPDDIYRQYVMNTGRLLKQEIREVMTSGQYLTLVHPEDKHKLLESASQRARSKSRKDLERRLESDFRIFRLVNQ